MIHYFTSLFNAAKSAIPSSNVRDAMNKVFLWMLQLLQQTSWYISLDAAIRENRVTLSAPPTFLYLPPGYFNDTSPYTEDATQSLDILWNPSRPFGVKYSVNELIAGHMYFFLVLSLIIGVLLGAGTVLLFIHQPAFLRLARLFPMSPLLLGTPAESTFVQTPIDEKKEDDKSIGNLTFEFLFGRQATPGSSRKIRHYSETGRGPSSALPSFFPTTPSPILSRLYTSTDSPAFDLALHQPMMVRGIGLGISVSPIEYLRSRMAAIQEDVIVNQVTIPDALERPEVAEHVQTALRNCGKEYKDARVGQDEKFEENNYLDELVLGAKDGQGNGDVSIEDLVVMKIDIGVQSLPEANTQTEVAICSKCRTHIPKLDQEKIMLAEIEGAQHVTTDLKESSLDIMDAFEHAIVAPTDDEGDEDNVSILGPLNREPLFVITSPTLPRPGSALSLSYPSPSSPPPEYAQIIPQVEDLDTLALPDDSKVVEEVERQEQEQELQEGVAADETFELPYEEMAKCERVIGGHRDLPEIDYEEFGLEPEEQQQEQASREVVAADETFELPYEEMAKWERLMGERTDLPEIDYEKEFGLGPEEKEQQQAARGADDTFELPYAEMEKYERLFDEPMDLPEEDYVDLIPEERDEEYKRKMEQVMKLKQERYLIRKAKANGERLWIPSKEDKKIIDFLRPWEHQLCNEFNVRYPNASVQEFIRFLKRRARTMKMKQERENKKEGRKADRQIHEMFLPWMDSLKEEFTRVHPNGDKKRFQEYLREDVIQARAEVFAVLVNPYLEQHDDATVDGVQAYVAQWAIEEQRGADDTFELPYAEMEKYERLVDEPMNLPEEDYVGLIPEEMDEEYKRKIEEVMKQKQERYRIRKAKANGERLWTPSKEDKKIIDFLRPWEDQLCNEFNVRYPNASVQEFVQFLKIKAKTMKGQERMNEKEERKADREIHEMFLPWMDGLKEEFTRVHPNGDNKQFQIYLREDVIQARAEVFAVLVNPYLEQHEDATVDGVQAYVAQWAVEEQKTHVDVMGDMEAGEKKRDEEDARIIKLLAPQRQELVERFMVEQPTGGEGEFMVFLREYAAELEKRQEFMGVVTSFLEAHPDATEEEYVAFIENRRG